MAASSRARLSSSLDNEKDHELLVDGYSKHKKTPRLLPPWASTLGIAILLAILGRDSWAASSPDLPGPDPDKALHHYVHQGWTAEEGLASKSIKRPFLDQGPALDQNRTLWQTWRFRVATWLLIITTIAMAWRFRIRAKTIRARSLEGEIAKRRKIEKALQDSEDFGRAIFNSLPMAVAVIDPEGRIVRVNRTWRDAGRENSAPEELVAGVGLNYLDVCRTVTGPDALFAQSCLAGFQSLFDEKTQVFDLEYACHAPSLRRWFVMRAVPLESDDGGIVVSHIDITQRKLAEIALRESEGRHQQERNELAHAQRVAALGELTGALAHEINQPLTAIASNTQAALRFLGFPEPDMIEIRSILEDVSSSSERAASVVRNLRSLLSKRPAEPEMVDLNHLLEDTCLLLQSDAVMNGVSMHQDADLDLPKVFGNRAQLQQVILNLIMNGFDAMRTRPSGDRILVLRTRAVAGPAVLVSIEDNGVGLAGRDPKELFSSFYSSKQEGLGLGLPISRSIVDTHGGKIWGESKGETGAVFHFELPARN